MKSVSNYTSRRQLKSSDFVIVDSVFTNLRVGQYIARLVSVSLLSTSLFAVISKVVETVTIEVSFYICWADPDSAHLSSPANKIGL